MKRLLSLLLALALCLSLVPATAYAEKVAVSSEPVTVEEPVESEEPADDEEPAEEPETEEPVEEAPEDVPADEELPTAENLPDDAEVVVKEGGTCCDNATYTITDVVLTISGREAIWSWVFNGRDDITSVSVGSGITKSSIMPSMTVLP